MTYEEFREKYPEHVFGDVIVERDYEYPYLEELNQWGNKIQDCSRVIDKGWIIQLPHSCDEWVIGDVEAAESMVSDLREAIEFCKNNT